MAKWYFSPSSQQSNGSHGYNEEEWNNKLCDTIMIIMQRHGETCKRNNPANTYAMHTIESNAWGSDFHVPLHSNAIASDAMTWQTTRSGPTVGCSNPLNAQAKGTILSKLIYDKLYDLWQPRVKRPIADYTFWEVEKTNMPCAYVEGFYHDNPNDQKFAIERREDIAIAISKACLEMVGKTYDGLEEQQPMYRIQAGYDWRNKTYAEIYKAKLEEAGFIAKIIETIE